MSCATPPATSTIASAPAYRFVGLLDGTRTVNEAWDLVGGQLADDAPTQNEVIQILSQLHSANLVESNVTPDAAVLLRRHKKMVQRQWQGRLMNILFPRIPLWDADMFLQRWMPVMKYLLSAFGAILWLAVVGGAIFAIAPSSTRLAPAGKTPSTRATGRRCGRRSCSSRPSTNWATGSSAGDSGARYTSWASCFSCWCPRHMLNASTAWGFANKWHRILVGAGGMIFELFVAAIMAFIWLNTREGTAIHGLAYNVMLIASVSTVIFNANPLLRYDGYYILADWLEIPNLRYRSSEYSLGLMKRHLFKVKLPQPLPPLGQRVWLLLYSIASSAYRTFVGIMIILMVWQRVPVLGVLMALGGVVTWLAVPLVKVGKYLLIEPELHRKRWCATAWVVAAVATVVVLIGLIRFDVTYDAMAVVEPERKSIIYPQTDGTIDRVIARDGQWLNKGDIIVVCRNDQLDAEIAQYQAKIEGLRARLRKAVVEDQSERSSLERQIYAYEQFLKEDFDKQAKLTIRARSPVGWLRRNCTTCAAGSFRAPTRTSSWPASLKAGR